MRVLILGCGPAGLIAAQAAYECGADVMIMSKNRKSFMKGAQYLHRPVPGIDCGEPFEISYLMEGSPTAYRLKVYGPKWDGTVSPEDLEKSHSGWDIRKAYDALWEKFQDHITAWEATPGGLYSFIMRADPHLVVSSVPASLLCSKGHTFRATRVWSTDRSLLPNINDNTVVCNGLESPRWYRTSKIQGWENTEWPDGVKPPITPMWEVQKPLDNNCDCFPDVLRVGRYGSWKKGVLSHEAYADVVNAINTHLFGAKS